MANTAIRRRYVSARDVRRYVTAHVTVRKVTGHVTKPPARRQNTVGIVNVTIVIARLEIIKRFFLT